MKTYTVEEVDRLINNAILYGQQSNRLPQSFVIKNSARKTLSDMIKSKIEDPDVKDNNVISAALVAFLRGYAEGLIDMSEFVGVNENWQ